MNKELMVNGYLFSSLEEANVARMELNKIEKLNEKTENADISLLYKIYMKSIEKNTFRTPVGYEYLSNLKQILDENGSFEMVPIPVNPSSVTQKEEYSKGQIGELKKEAEKKKKMFAWSIYINIILFLMILFMFYIVTTSKSPNIINYENALVDKYSQWEQELSEREAEINAKEKLLNDF